MVSLNVETIVLPGRVSSEVSLMVVVLGGNVMVAPDSVTVDAGTTLVSTEITVTVVGGRVTVDRMSEEETTVERR